MKRSTETGTTRRLRSGDETLAIEAVTRLTSVQERDGHTPTASHMSRLLRNPDAYLFVHTEENVPIGYLLAFRFDRLDRDANMVYLYDICVLPSRRRRGIGRRLIEGLKGSVAGTDAAEIWVGTSIDNEPARALFAGTGAREVSDRYVEFLYPREGFA